LNSDTLRSICLKILKKNNKKSLDHKILEGIDNIYYISRPKKNTKKNGYIANDRSWYFFPWNKDKTKLSKLVQPIFNTITKINKYDPNEIIKFTPKNGLVQRFHLIFYPKNSGEISPHVDPCNIVQVQSGIYITSFGKDYSSGGFYVLNKKKEKVFIDHYMNSGDLILFSPKVIHGVTPVKCSNITKGIFDGRFFLNMNIVESHHVKNRHKAIGKDNQ